MKELEKLYERYNQEIEYYSVHTKNQYRAQLSEYLKFVDNRDWQDRDVLYNYVQKLKKRGYAQNHINYLVRGPIGALFRAYGLRIPVKLPRVMISGLVHDLVSAVQFTPEEIVAIIQAARKGTAQEKALVAISTTYGARVTEIQNVKPKDVHSQKKTLVIHTVKSGLLREHMVPLSIEPYIFGYDYPETNHNELSQLLMVVEERAGIKHTARKSFHAIRHGLCNEMLYGAKIDAQDVYTFLRWKGSGMLATYAPYHPNIDENVFAKHPFLKYWL